MVTSDQFFPGSPQVEPRQHTMAQPTDTTGGNRGTAAKSGVIRTRHGGGRAAIGA